MPSTHDIIDLSVTSSSPVPAARQPRRRPVLRGKALNVQDVIELTDSDDDNAARRAGPSKKPNVRADAGPSRAVAPPSAFPLVKEPLFLPDDERDNNDMKIDAFQERAAEGNSDNQGALVDAPPILPPSERFSPIPEAPQPAHAPTPPPLDPFDAYVAQILEVVPDVLPDHARSLVEENHATTQDAVVQRVLHLLFENPTYPKLDRKGKRKRVEGDEGGGDRARSKAKLDYASKDRPMVGGADYVELALEQLFSDLPLIPKTHVRKTLVEQNHLYAPTHLVLAAQDAQDKPPYTRRTEAQAQIHGRAKAKGKARARHDDEFERERAWIVERADAARAEAESERACLESGEGIECGCCFTDYPFHKMVQCPDAHLFCASCITSYASTLLGTHSAAIVCVDQSGCKLPFARAELERILSEPLLALYDRVVARKEVEAAEIDGLEECPFCEYKVVIENEAEKLFRCQAEACGAVSCRVCKKPDHLPKSCKEMEEDKHLDAQHEVEEAMTRALMRNCPKCQKAFVKEHGCNKMSCPNCHTLSCYVCRKIIGGYEHFNQAPPYNGPKDASKCPLWDTNTDMRHDEEVAAAAKKALDKLKAANPDTDLDAIKVDVPKPVAGPSNANAHGRGPHHAHVMMNPEGFLFRPDGPLGMPDVFGDAGRAHMNARLRAMRVHEAAPAPNLMARMAGWIPGRAAQRDRDAEDAAAIERAMEREMERMMGREMERQAILEREMDREMERELEREQEYERDMDREMELMAHQLRRQARQDDRARRAAAVLAAARPPAPEVAPRRSQRRPPAAAPRPAPVLAPAPPAARQVVVLQPGEQYHARFNINVNFGGPPPAGGRYAPAPAPRPRAPRAPPPDPPRIPSAHRARPRRAK